MSHLYPPTAFLFLCKNTKDSKKIDAAIRKEKLGHNKLAAGLYLGFFFDFPEVVYQTWRREFGIEGEIHWIPISKVEVTK